MYRYTRRIGSNKHLTFLTLSRDTRGAIMVFGVFFCVLLTSVIFYMMGIGRTLLFQEGLQDAADAAGMSSAILHARGMNLIVYLNMLMAALIAILIALRLVQGLCTLAAAILFALGPITFGATVPPANLAAQQVYQFQNYYNKAKKTIFRVLEGIHQLEKFVSITVPSVATASALWEAARHHDAADGAFALPPALTLPVEIDEFNRLCGKGARFVSSLAFAPLGDDIKNVLGDVVESASESLSSFLCGDGSTQIPSLSKKEEKGFPEIEGAERCSSKAECADLVNNPEMEERAAAAKPTGEGECQPGQDCSRTGPYEQRAILARDQCEPRPGFTPHSYSYRAIVYDIEYEYKAHRWEVVKKEKANTASAFGRRQADEYVDDSNHPPCGPDGVIGDEWNRLAYPPGARALVPLCTSGEEPPASPRGGQTKTTIQRTEVTHLFGCKVWVTHKQDLAKKEDAFGAEGNKKRSPMRVEEEVKLDTETFFIRTVAFGSKPGPQELRDGVKLATWNQPTTDDGSVVEEVEDVLSSVGQILGHISVAQSEYYFEDILGTTPREDLMWRPNWTARLRRFQLADSTEKERENERRRARSEEDQELMKEHNTGDKPQTTEGSCSEAGGKDCGEMEGALDIINDLLVH